MISTMKSSKKFRTSFALVALLVNALILRRLLLNASLVDTLNFALVLNVKRI